MTFASEIFLKRIQNVFFMKMCQTKRKKIPEASQKKNTGNKSGIFSFLWYS